MRRHLLWSALAFIGALQAHYLAELWYVGVLVLVIGALLGEWLRAEFQYDEEGATDDQPEHRQRGQ